MKKLSLSIILVFVSIFILSGFTMSNNRVIFSDRGVLSLTYSRVYVPFQSGSLPQLDSYSVVEEMGGTFFIRWGATESRLNSVYIMYRMPGHITDFDLFRARTHEFTDTASIIGIQNGLDEQILMFEIPVFEGEWSFLFRSYNFGNTQGQNIGLPRGRSEYIIHSTIEIDVYYYSLPIWSVALLGVIGFIIFILTISLVFKIVKKFKTKGVNT